MMMSDKFVFTVENTFWQHWMQVALVGFIWYTLRFLTISLYLLFLHQSPVYTLLNLNLPSYLWLSHRSSSSVLFFIVLIKAFWYHLSSLHSPIFLKSNPSSMSRTMGNKIKWRNAWRVKFSGKYMCPAIAIQLSSNWLEGRTRNLKVMAKSDLMKL